MKKMIRTAVVALSIACATCAVALPGMAASTGETPTYTTSNTTSVSQPAAAPNVSGSYRTGAVQARNTVKPSAFLAPTVYVNPVTHAISNVYDANGNLIPATLSTDGHYYIVPTNDGYLYIATGY